MRAIVLNCRMVKMLALLVLINPKLALSDANLAHSSRLADMGIREFGYELDPEDNGNCISLGALDIVFRTHNPGLPNVGVVLTDPRGRRLGFDPLTKKAWQTLPVALGYINCDDLDGQGRCRGVVQVCGPVSGTYKLEIIAQETTAYGVSISARSKVIPGKGSLHCSETDLNDVAIRARSRSIILLNYSRDPQDDVTAQLRHTGQTQSLESHSHRHVEVKSAEHPVAGQ